MLLDSEGCHPGDLQSKITELDERNMELMKEVKRLHQENQNLDARTQALVRLVHQKNAQLDQLKETVRGTTSPGLPTWGWDLGWRPDSRWSTPKENESVREGGGPF